MNEHEAKERIIQATIDLLQTTSDPSNITVRQIAQLADVGVGSINYNFGSKDELINEAVWRIVGDVAANWYSTDTTSDIDPVTRLRQLFKDSTRVMFQHRKFMEIGIRHVILKGEMQAKSLILPLLREIYGSQKGDIELRLIAFQLIASLQVAFLNIDQLGMFLGVDISKLDTMNNIIDMAIDNLINQTPGDKK